jgi:hypothetical protein
VRKSIHYLFQPISVEFKNEEGSDEEGYAGDPSHSSSDGVNWLSYGFPIITAPGQSQEGIRNSLLSMLPNASVAQRFAESYFRHAAWMYTPIPEVDFQQLFQRIYDPGVTSQHDRIDAHALSVFYLVLALGTLLDPGMPSHSSEAAQYYQLGRVALALQSVLEEQSITAIRALVSYLTKDSSIVDGFFSVTDVPLHVPVWDRRTPLGNHGVGGQTGA